MRTTIRTSFPLTAALLLSLATQAHAQSLPPNMPTKEQLANDNNLFLSFARKALKWEEAEAPIKIIGPLYFVGTKGLGVFLFTTPEGHILMNTGMPSSGPMIVDSERAVGDHDRNTLRLRLDLQGDPTGFEPGMSVWLGR